MTTPRASASPTSSQRRTAIAGPSVWHGPELARSREWLHPLSATAISEIHSAVRGIQSRSLDLARVRRGDFPLAGLGPVLDDLRTEVVEGRGFVLLRGLPVETWTLEEAAIAYWGLGTYFGDAVSQNAQGHLLGHVRDLGGDAEDPRRRVYTTNRRQRFHTDSADIVALLCLRTARRGGASSVVSSPALYNELLGRRPDLAEILCQPFFVDRKGEVPEGKDPYYQIPVFHRYGGHLTTIYARDFIDSAQRFSEVPRLSGPQLEAMDLLESLAESKELRLDMELEPGDVQILHNHQVLHARTAYEDHDDPARKRHLLRLWLAPANGRPLPPVFAERYGSVTPGRRGGIRVAGARLHAPLAAR